MAGKKQKALRKKVDVSKKGVLKAVRKRRKKRQDIMKDLFGAPPSGKRGI